MFTNVFSEILEGLYDNTVVPYLGPSALLDAKNRQTGAPMPATSHSLMLAMNNGSPMVSEFSDEFSRAAMDMELKRGRNFLDQFLAKLYGESKWTRAAVHDWLAEWKPHYVIDINRDSQLQDTYADEEHFLIVGVAHHHFRFHCYHFDCNEYLTVHHEQVDPTIPLLFKPLGTSRPEANYIASNADYVDYMTELMGGFAIPDFLKDYRKDKRYLLIGVPLNSDFEQLVMSGITHDAGQPRGWVLNKQPTAQEQRFCEKVDLKIIDADVQDLLSAIGFAEAEDGLMA